MAIRAPDGANKYISSSSFGSTDSISLIKLSSKGKEAASELIKFSEEIIRLPQEYSLEFA